MEEEVKNLYEEKINKLASDVSNLTSQLASLSTALNNIQLGNDSTSEQKQDTNEAFFNWLGLEAK